MLAFVGRRVESNPVIVLAAICDGYDSPLLQPGLPELHLERLPDPAAGELLNVSFPDLAPLVRDRLQEPGRG